MTFVLSVRKSQLLTPVSLSIQATDNNRKGESERKRARVIYPKTSSIPILKQQQDQINLEILGVGYYSGWLQ
ncbi:hypothetical protein FRX31_035025 [Thalictrum thalictroides]|uniref:Uncharacterized protein n=1 Tax=Thalictrum thalictroides TaxID=46969 RepID=A0A7J6US86_THATH|nr:hypothetical protein FRX31_035025 [Thalictrum thalictroides]